VSTVRQIWQSVEVYWQELQAFFPHGEEVLATAERKQRMALLTKALELLLPFAVLLAVLNVLAMSANGSFWFGLLANVPGLCLIPLMLWLTKREQYRSLVLIPPFLLIPIVYFQAILTGPPYVYLVLLSIFPIYGTLLLYVRWNYLLALLSVLALVGFYVLFPSRMSVQTFLQWLSVFIMLEVVLLFFAAYMSRMETSQLRAQRNQERLGAMRDFIRNVSHDFRTPLTVIQSSTYLLLRLDDPAKRKRQAAQIDRMVERMEQMLNNTVLLARLQSTTNIDHAPVNTNEVLEILREEFMGAAQEQDITLDMEIPPNLPTIDGDAELLLISLRHVLENALRYTDHGGSVWVSAQTTGKGLSISIADSGMGIPHDQLEKIFEPMYRTDTARAMDTGGTGVGLSIAKLVVELHGGRIHVTSEEGVGSQFTLELPMPWAQVDRPWLDYFGKRNAVF